MDRRQGPTNADVLEAVQGIERRLSRIEGGLAFGAALLGLLAASGILFHIHFT